MRFMYWCRMHELARKRVKVPNTMLVRHEMVMYLHGVEREGGGVEAWNSWVCTYICTYMNQELD